MAGSTDILQLIEADNDGELGIAVLAAKAGVEGFLPVETGRAAALVRDDVRLSVLVARSREPAAYVVSRETLSRPEPCGIMLRREDAPFKTLVDRTTADLCRSPEITALHERRFLEPVPPRGRNYDVPLSDDLRSDDPRSDDLRWAFAHPTEGPDPATCAGHRDPPDGIRATETRPSKRAR